MPALEALSSGEVIAPTMPVATYLQEAEDLCVWMGDDRVALESVGQSPVMMDSLPVRIGALRELESAWMVARHNKDKAQAAYEEMSREAFSAFISLVRHARYAFRNHPRLQGQLPRTTGWVSDTNRIQDINDLAVLCRAHMGLLAESGFNLTLVDSLGTLSDDLANQKAMARSERAGGRGSKVMRDRAFTHLKKAVDEIRAAGRFLFWDDATRLQGYKSAYQAKAARSQTAGDDIQETHDGSGEDAVSVQTPQIVPVNVDDPARAEADAGQAAI